MRRIIVLGVLIISVLHSFLGLVSLCVGVASSIQAEVWLAHSVSPIWSGGFFLITGILGVLCSKKKTAYLIMCFTAFSVVSLVTAVVSIQLLRLGLVNHTTDGHTFQKEHKDVLIIIALVAAGTECLVCLFSAVFSCRMAKAAKKELFKQREGMFHVKEDDDDTIYRTESSIAFDIHGSGTPIRGIEEGVLESGMETVLEIGIGGFHGDNNDDVDAQGHNDDQSEEDVEAAHSRNGATTQNDDKGYDTDQERSDPGDEEASNEHFEIMDDAGIDTSDITLGVVESKTFERHPITPQNSLCKQASQTSTDVPEVNT